MQAQKHSLPSFRSSPLHPTSLSLVRIPSTSSLSLALSLCLFFLPHAIAVNCRRMNGASGALNYHCTWRIHWWLSERVTYRYLRLITKVNGNCLMSASYCDSLIVTGYRLPAADHSLRVTANLWSLAVASIPVTDHYLHTNDYCSHVITGNEMQFLACSSSISRSLLMTSNLLLIIHNLFLINVYCKTCCD